MIRLAAAHAAIELLSVKRISRRIVPESFAPEAKRDIDIAIGSMKTNPASDHVA